MARKTTEQELQAYLLRCMVIHVQTSDGLNEAVLVDIMKKENVDDKLAALYPQGYTVVNKIPRIKHD